MAANQKVGYPRRGEIYLVGLDPAVGSEMRKTRPSLILQNDIGNRFSATTIIAVLTSQIDEKRYPTEVPVEPPEGGLSSPSVVRFDQLRTVDKRRLQRRLGRLAPSTMARVDVALRISLDLLD